MKKKPVSLTLSISEEDAETYMTAIRHEYAAWGQHQEHSTDLSGSLRTALGRVAEVRTSMRKRVESDICARLREDLRALFVARLKQEEEVQS
jgi:predicted metal-dependent HD superfamily phosphohydrolase